MSGALALLERLGDGLNPILVKEVRQALRGRYFRVSFWFTLSAASVFGMAWLFFQAGAEDSSRALGVGFYGFAFSCLVVATHGLVPFSAFVAMGAEWEENTYDLLVLSNLRPRQIVLGKVWAAGIQALLFYSAFVPFLVFAFLLRGIDLLALGMSLGGSLVVSFALACLATALSTLTAARFPRMMLMALLTAFLITVPVAQGVAAATMAMRFPSGLHSAEAQSAFAAMATTAVAAGFLFVLVGAARLAHPEENRSTGLRLYALLLLALGLGWPAWLSLRFGAGMRAEQLLLIGLVAQLYVTVAALFFATEPERLGRRARGQVPRRAALRVLAVPFLPGGGRGLLWYLLGSALVVAWVYAMAALSSGAGSRFAGLDFAQRQVPIVAACYGGAFLGLGSLLFARRSEDARVRLLARITIPGLVVLAMFVPALVGFFLRSEAWLRFEHPGNPMVVLAALVRGHADRIPWAIEGPRLAAAAVCIANLPRLFDAGAELFGRARAPRAARAARPPAAPGDAA